MTYVHPWIYFSGSRTFIFYLNNNSELSYKIMYEDDKWTKELKIDRNVLDFAINIDEKNQIFIIYSTKNSSLKYCIYGSNKWMGKILYQFENEKYQISDIAAHIIDKKMHIFFTVQNIEENGKLFLMYFCLNSKKILSSMIYDLLPIEGMKSYYQTEIQEDGTLSLIYAAYEENKVRIKYTACESSKWIKPQILYGITGTDINFSTIMHDNKIYILNFSKEDSVYSIESAIIEDGKNTKNDIIYKTSDKPDSCILLEKENLLYAILLFSNKILVSLYKNDNWNKISEYNIENKNAECLYRFLYSQNKYNIKAKYIICTPFPEIKVFSFKSEDSDCKTSDTENGTLNIKKEYEMLKRSNKILREKILSLQLELEKKQRIINESEGNFLKLTDSKKKIENNLNMLSQVQQSSNQKLELLEKQKINYNNTIFQLKSTLQQLLEEKSRLSLELESQKKKGIINRLLKK